MTGSRSRAGIAEFHTCLPHEKAGKVEELIAAGETVMMVGDGINDAPALATASVVRPCSLPGSSRQSAHKFVSLIVQGVSIGVSDLASDSADVVLLATAGTPTTPTTTHTRPRPGPPHSAGKAADWRLVLRRADWQAGGAHHSGEESARRRQER